MRRRRSRSLKNEFQSSVDLGPEAATAAAAAASALAVEDEALAKHRACEAIVVGEAVRALGINRRMMLLEFEKLLPELALRAVECCFGAARARQTGRAAVDNEALAQHRATVRGWLPGAVRGKRRAIVLREEDMITVKAANEALDSHRQWRLVRGWSIDAI